MTGAQEKPIGGDDKYLTLGIDREVFALPVEHVQEILDMCEISRLPYAPPYMAGMIDVRGRGVPVLDLRARLGLPSIPVSAATRIVVLDLPLDGRRLVIGLIADRVIEVTGLDDNTLQQPPEIGTGWRSDCITGIGRRGPHFVIVFDLPKLFAAERIEVTAPPDVAA
ncbi:MAG TPA: chemotaxis protein CheW [Stellaceae bacterium]|jgi:purine-binding chemotaxis protein CheW|nr:chemotaxis protein CheW [Stellaceae bacterium]